MKRTLILAAAALLAVPARAGRFHLGMPGAVKDVGQKLEDKINQSIAAGTILTGHAASGRAIALGAVTVEDCLLRTKMAVTAADGSFSVNVAGLTFPMLLQVKGAPNFYGIAFGPGTSNVDTYTDLILRTHYAAQGISNLDTAFTGSFTSLCGVQQSAIGPLTSMVMNMAGPPMTRNGLDPTSYNPFTTVFSANSSGFDAVLDQTKISANLNYSTVTITDLNTGVVLSTITPVVGASSAPAVPTNIVFLMVSSNSVTLSWTASVSSYTAGYAIYRDSAILTYVPTTTYTDATLTPGTTYAYAVSAFNWLGTQSPSASTQTVVTGVPLNVSALAAGTGSGTITSSPAGINCGSTCSAVFAKNTTVTLTAVPAAGSIFAGWSGVFSSSGVSAGNGILNTTVSGGQSVVAWFNKTSSAPPNGTQTLAVAKIIEDAGADGIVTSSPTGISCPIGTLACSFNFTTSQQVSLTAVPKTGYVFSGWGGDCSGMTCQVAMSSAKNVLAAFSAAGPTYTPLCPPGNTTCVCASGNPCALTLVSGPQGGSPPYSYALDSSGSPPLGTSVDLFTGNLSGAIPSGATAGSYTFRVCIVDMSLREFCPQSTVVVTAPQTLTVSLAGTGSGSVASSPAGIACGATCSAGFASGAKVVLTAVAASGSTFAGWSGGGCSGTGACSVTMNAAASVTATFNVQSGGGGGGGGILASALQLLFDVYGDEFGFAGCNPGILISCVGGGGTQTCNQDCTFSATGAVQWSSCTEKGGSLNASYSFNGTLVTSSCSGNTGILFPTNVNFTLSGSNFTINGQSCSVNLTVSGMYQTLGGLFGVVSGTACGQSVSVPSLSTNWNTLY